MGERSALSRQQSADDPLLSARHLLRLYFRLLGAQVRSQLVYRTAFALDALAAALITGAEFAAFALVLPRFGGWVGGRWGRSPCCTASPNSPSC